MTPEQFKSLMEYIDCRIDEKIEVAMGGVEDTELTHASREASKKLKRLMNVPRM